MQNGEEHGAFDGKLELATGHQIEDDFLAAGFLPKPFEDQRGSDALGRDDGSQAIAVGGEQQDVLSKASTGGEQSIEVAGLAELVESADGGEHALGDAAVLPGILDDLQVLAGAGGFDAEKHGGLLIRTPQR